MENSPFSHNSGESQFPSHENKDEDKDSKKSKSKSKKADGFFDKAPEKSEKTEKSSDSIEKDLDKTIDLGSFMLGKTDTTSETASEVAGIESDSTAPELTNTEQLEAVQQMATERQNELRSESESEETHGPELEAAKEYYDKIIAEDALPETAAESVIQAIETNTESVSENQKEDETEEQKEDQVAVSAPAATPRTPPAALVNAPNLPPAGAPPGNPNNPNFGPPGRIPVNPNTPNSSPPNPNMSNTSVRTEYVPYIDRSRAFGDMLVGGVVGYLIGRRRGRIKTERKLLPVQRKLETEVGALKKQVIDGEYAVRAAAKRAADLTETNKYKLLKPTRQFNKPNPFNKSTERSFTAPERQIPHAIIAPEQIGKVVVLAESVRLGQTENIKPKPINEQIPAAQSLRKPEQLSIDKQVEVMSRNEVMSLSEKITVEGSTLRQVYETHLISERGLRRLVAEHLRGGNVLGVFKREVVERQIDFERDPKLRDEVRSSMASANMGSHDDANDTSGSNPLQQLLSKAGVAESQNQPNRRVSDDKANKKSKPAITPVDMSIAAVIAVLIAVIVVVLLSR